MDWRKRARNQQQKSRPKAAILCNGASDRARTGDPRFTRAVLYQLSYAGGHVMAQLRRQRLSMIRDIANPRKCSDGFSHFKCTNIGDAMSCSYGSQTEWGSDDSTQDSSRTHRRPFHNMRKPLSIGMFVRARFETGLFRFPSGEPAHAAWLSRRLPGKLISAGSCGCASGGQPGMSAHPTAFRFSVRRYRTNPVFCRARPRGCPSKRS